MTKELEICWELAALAFRALTIGITGLLFGRFIKPFLYRKVSDGGRSAWRIGAGYIFTMLLLTVIPFEMSGLAAHAVGILAFFGTIYRYDRRNLEQKIFLVFLLYLIIWTSYEIAMIPRELLYQYVLFSDSVMALTQWVYLGGYVLVETCYILCKSSVMYFLLNVIDRIYLYKNENMSRKELGLMLAIPFSMIIGHASLSFFSDIYLLDTKWYIQDTHLSYQCAVALYQLMSFAAIVAAVILYQDMKKNHRREKENAVLAGQLESLKKHIEEVEMLYQDIRGMRHEMGNHIMILENLCRRGEQREAAGYLEKLKEQFHRAGTEIKSGNPITDILLTEGRKEAEKRGIAFQCGFHYPEGAFVNAFDVSIILHNALNNALEGAEKCERPFIRLSSYREKNAYMIEIANSLKERLVLEEESGIPLTTKENREEHGHGLINIRKVAQKYFGDIDIEQRDGMFVLHILLMLE